MNNTIINTVILTLLSFNTKTNKEYNKFIIVGVDENFAPIYNDKGYFVFSNLCFGEVPESLVTAHIGTVSPFSRKDEFIKAMKLAQAFYSETQDIQVVSHETIVEVKKTKEDVKVVKATPTKIKKVVSHEAIVKPVPKATIKKRQENSVLTEKQRLAVLKTKDVDKGLDAIETCLDMIEEGSKSTFKVVLKDIKQVLKEAGITGYLLHGVDSKEVASNKLDAAFKLLLSELDDLTCDEPQIKQAVKTPIKEIDPVLLALQTIMGRLDKAGI